MFRAGSEQPSQPQAHQTGPDRDQGRDPSKSPADHQQTGS